MPSLVFLTAVLSLEVTRQLVSLGYGLGYDTDAAASTKSGVGRFTGANAPNGSPYAPLAIVGCTGNGVSPIVVTTQYPHGVSARGIGGLACIVNGVTGNTAASNVSTAPQDRTVGLVQGVLAKPLTATTLALYGQDQGVAATGQIVPLVGNGAWTGGGTITPALTDGQILLGRENVKEHSSPPRIVLVPRTITPGPRAFSTPNRARATERSAQTATRGTGSDLVKFDVHCWGQRLPVPDAAFDYDVTLALEQTVKDAAYLLFGATSQGFGPSVWDDENERSAQFVKSGHLLTFSIPISVPVLDNVLGFAPSGITGEVVVQSPKPEIAQVIDKVLS